MKNILNLMKRKPDSDRGSFVEYAGETIYKAFKKFAELFIKMIKKIIKTVWNSV